MENMFSRTQKLIGEKGIDQLERAKVTVVGIGGVGSFTAEALARSGVGNLVLIDSDIVSPSNINRQILALHSTIGLAKVDVMKERILDINPQAIVNIHRVFYSNETENLITEDCDYIVDAIDSMKSKLELILRCRNLGLPIISAMGAGNKLDPTMFKVSDISKTSVCPMARKLRRELRRHGINQGLKVVYSTESPIIPAIGTPQVPGSISFVPSVMGLIIAGEVVRDLINI